MKAEKPPGPLSTVIDCFVSILLEGYVKSCEALGVLIKESPRSVRNERRNESANGEFDGLVIVRSCSVSKYV